MGFDSPSIIRYLKPLTGDVFKACFKDCHFNETIFPPLGGEKSFPEAQCEITWNVSTLSHLDPRINPCELEVQRIIHLQGIANQLPDVFTDNKKIMKFHIPAANTLARIEVPVGQSVNTTTNESKPHLKRGRPVNVKDKIPWKRKVQENQVIAHKETIPRKHVTEIIDLSKTYEKKSPENKPLKELSPEEDQVLENNEILIHYVHTVEIWDRNKIVVDNIFSYKVALDITRSNDNEYEPQTIDKCQRINDWPMWKEAIHAELNSISKHEVFGPVV